MASNNSVVVAFDLYGTLLDPSSIATKLSKYFGEEQGNAVAAKWRLYQLEYTWRLNSMEQYEPFSAITRRSLAHALNEISLSLSDQEIEDLMTAYDSLSAFRDVTPALKSLASASGISSFIFSNGTQSMVTNSVTKSADLSPHASLFQDIITVEQVKRYKPAPVVYEHLAEKVGKSKKELSDIWLVSGNPFDIVGARAMGMRAAWVDRSGGDWVDQLGQRPTVVLKSLEDLPTALKDHSSP